MPKAKVLKFSSVIVLAVLLSIAPRLSAQDPPNIALGLNSQATYYGGDVDSVDMTTGRLNLHIPLYVDHSQRGDLNFSYDVYYASPGVWNQICSKTFCHWSRGVYGILGPEIGSPDFVSYSTMTRWGDGYFYQYKHYA